jgi:hypothetical protein
MRGENQQGIEPPSGLVNAFGNKISREVVLKKLLVLKGVVY